MLIDLHVLIDTEEQEMICVKEAVAMALERLGKVKVSEVKVAK